MNGHKLLLFQEHTKYGIAIATKRLFEMERIEFGKVKIGQTFRFSAYGDEIEKTETRKGKILDALNAIDADGISYFVLDDELVFVE